MYVPVETHIIDVFHITDKTTIHFGIPMVIILLAIYYIQNYIGT